MSEREDVAWSQIYRPKTVAECILPARLKNQFQKYVDDGQVLSMILAGTPGIGKTTVAKAMCEQIGCDYIVINGSDDNGMDMLRSKLKMYASTLSMNGKRKVVIIDEADYITPNAQAAMRNVMEEFSKNCSFILTCNYKSKLIEALHSRAPVIEMRLVQNERAEMALELMKRIKEILAKENVVCNDDAILVEVIKKFFPDYRKTLNKLQHYVAQSGGNELNSGILSDSGDRDLNELLGFMKDKKFRQLRQWVAKNSDNSAEVFRMIFDVAHEKFTPNTFPDAILILGEYQYRSAFVADQEINLIACLVDMMTKCELR